MNKQAHTTVSNGSGTARKPRSMLLAAPALALIFAAVGCTGEVMDDGDGPEEVGSTQAQLTMGYTTNGCSIAEVQNLGLAMNLLVNDLGSNFVAFQACINSTPLVEFSCAADQSRERIIDQLLATQVTNINCRQLAPNVLGEAPISVSAGQLSVDHNFVLNSTTADLAATIAHEIMHNWGYQHSQNAFGSQFYPNTVPEQVEACVRQGFPNASQGSLTASFEDRCDGGSHITQRQGMHACPVGMYMTGAHLSSNHFLCKSFPGRTYQTFEEIIDTGATQQLGMHTCPRGFALTGLHAGKNHFLCAPFANQGASSVDTGTQRQGMHACPVGKVQTGLHAGNNWLACAP